MSKLIIHNIFSAGVVAACFLPSLTTMITTSGLTFPSVGLASQFVSPIPFAGGWLTGPLSSVSSSAILGFIPLWIVAVWTDGAIDGFGHRRVWSQSQNKSIPVRTARTHSVLTAPVVGVIVGLAAGMLFEFVMSFLGFSFPVFWQWTVLAGLLASCCHLVADLPTHAGVFGITGKQRLAIFHWKDTDLKVCFLFGLIGVVGLITGFGQWGTVFASLHAGVVGP